MKLPKFNENPVACVLVWSVGVVILLKFCVHVLVVNQDSSERRALMREVAEERRIQAENEAKVEWMDRMYVEQLFK